MPSCPITRPMMRCTACGAWWSGPPHYPANDTRAGQPLDPRSVPASCGCGGQLAHADLDGHIAKLPYKPHDPSKDKPGSAPKPPEGGTS